MLERRKASERERMLQQRKMLWRKKEKVMEKETEEN